MDLRRLGAVLRSQREELGMPAAELARRVSVSPTYVWMVENARPRASGEPSRPSRDLLEHWTRELKMDGPSARQVLGLADYGHERRPSVRSARSYRAAEEPPSGRPMLDALFAAPAPVPAEPGVSPAFIADASAMVHEAPSADLDTDLPADALTGELHALLARAEHEGRLDETVDLLQSFFAFLRHRLGA